MAKKKIDLAIDVAAMAIDGLLKPMTLRRAGL
jgi:hypothetical protein